jgi:hypothetical protein
LRDSNNDNNKMPPIGELEKVERAELQAKESLQVSDDGHSIKCQRCEKYVSIPVMGAGVYKNRAHDSKIVRLQNQMERIKSYPHGNGNADIEKQNDIKKISQQITELEEEEVKRQKLRSLPVHKIRISKFKFLFVCGNCFDQLYPRRYRMLIINE